MIQKEFPLGIKFLFSHVLLVRCDEKALSTNFIEKSWIFVFVEVTEKVKIFGEKWHKHLSMNENGHGG